MRTKLDLFWIGKKPDTKLAVIEYIENPSLTYYEICSKYGFPSFHTGNNRVAYNIKKLIQKGLLVRVGRREGAANRNLYEWTEKAKEVI